MSLINVIYNKNFRLQKWNATKIKTLIIRIAIVTS